MSKVRLCRECNGKGSKKGLVVFNDKKGEIITEMRLIVCKHCVGTGYEGLVRQN